MGAMGTVMVGLGAINAGMSIMGGFQQKKEADRNASAIEGEAAYNAGVYRQQAGMVEQAKQLKQQQDARKIRFAAGKTTAVTAHKGIEMSGTPVAVMVDTLTQMEMDKAITAYNYDVEKYSLESSARATEYRGSTLADSYRRQGRNAMMGGIISGLTTFAGSALFAASRLHKPNVMPGMKTTSADVFKAANIPNKPYDYGLKGSMPGATKLPYVKSSFDFSAPKKGIAP